MSPAGTASTSVVSLPVILKMCATRSFLPVREFTTSELGVSVPETTLMNDIRPTYGSERVLNTWPEKSPELENGISVPSVVCIGPCAVGSGKNVTISSMRSSTP